MAPSREWARASTASWRKLVRLGFNEALAKGTVGALISAGYLEAKFLTKKPCEAGKGLGGQAGDRGRGGASE